MSKRKINTMEELAAAIGVSRPTLSRYFHDSADVRPSTKARIVSGLEQVDYVPNFFATKMNRKHTGLIGVIVPQLNDLFYASLIEAIELRAKQEDFTVITQTSHGNADHEARAVEKLISMSVDGVIVAPLGHSVSIPALKRMNAEKPIVMVDSRLTHGLQDIDFVGTNNFQSISLIVDYLCRTGQPPVFLGMPRLNSNSEERERAYSNCMQKNGFEPALVSSSGIPDNWEFEAYGAAVMSHHFGSGNFTNATILCANDRLAIGAISAAHKFGLFDNSKDNGVRFRIAGHDDHPLSAYVTPPLTTVSQDKLAIADEAVRVLLDRIRSETSPDQVAVSREFPAVLKIRDSA